MKGKKKMNPLDNFTDPQHVVSIMDPRSKKVRWLLAAVIAVLVIAIISIGVMLTQREADNQDSLASVAAAKVTIDGTPGTPSTIKVQKGQSIVWENVDSQARLLALGSADTTAALTENQIGQGETYSYVFDEIGTFSYYDSQDPNRLSGIVIVE